MAWLRGFSPITLWGSSQSVGRLEWGLYFELITGIYAVIQGLVISSKQLDTQTGYDTACSARKNCCLRQADRGKCDEIAFFISHLMSAYNTAKTKAWLLKMWYLTTNKLYWLGKKAQFCTEPRRCHCGGKKLLLNNNLCSRFHILCTRIT